MDEQQVRRKLIEYLLHENSEVQNLSVPDSEPDQKKLLRALMNIRPPQPIDRSFLRLQDTYLQHELERKGIVCLQDLTPVRKHLYLWQGDITRLKCDVIVNAANSQMLGCFYPNHGCIDNAIHSSAGIQLRLECSDRMRERNMPASTGDVLLTSAWNLPARAIIHTVGPIVHGSLREEDKTQLRACYQNCLHLASEQGYRSIAFCCISTGEFHFPNQTAAEIAVETVREFLKDHEMEVIFNVFKDQDLAIYKKLLQSD